MFIVRPLFCLLWVISGSIVIGTDGEDADGWKSEALVYGSVTSVDRDKFGTYIIEIKPVATLTGRLDAAFEDKLSCKVSVDPAEITSVIQDVPKKGAKVLVFVVGTDELQKHKGLSVPNGPVMFMHENRGFVTVEGFDDPKVTETIEKLRKIRGKHRDEAEQREAEKSKKSSQPTSPH